MAHALKSRTGCYRCKQRRKKCDEVKPICGACSRRHFNCVWPSPTHESNVWLSQSVSKQVYTRLLLQRRYGRMDLALVYGSRTDCPVYSISPGYVPLRDQEQHRLFVSLSAFLKLQAAFTSHHDRQPKAGFEFTVALQRPWVRSSLLSLAALIAAARGIGPIAAAFEHYGAAVRFVSQRLSSYQQQESEELLVAALFLGLMDTNIVQNQIHPSCYYMTVGHLLRGLDVMNTDLLSRDLEDLSPALWFRRIAYESYLHQMAGGAFRHPQSYKSVRLVHPTEYAVGSLPSSVDGNTLAPLDLNCFYILYEVSRLYHSPTTANTIAELQTLQNALQGLRNRYQAGPDPEDDGFLRLQFKTLTRTAIGALQIFCAKAIDHTLIPSSPEIRQAREYSLEHLEPWFVRSLWPGYLSWILAILLCAAETEQDIRAICAKMDDFLLHVFSANLDHLKGILGRLNAIRSPMPPNQDGVTAEMVEDPLALMFSPP